MSAMSDADIRLGLHYSFVSIGELIRAPSRIPQTSMCFPFELKTKALSQRFCRPLGRSRSQESSITKDVWLQWCLKMRILPSKVLTKMCGTPSIFSISTQVGSLGSCWRRLLVLLKAPPPDIGTTSRNVHPSSRKTTTANGQSGREAADKSDVSNLTVSTCCKVGRRSVRASRLVICIET